MCGGTIQGGWVWTLVLPHSDRLTFSESLDLLEPQVPDL